MTSRLPLRQSRTPSSDSTSAVLCLPLQRQCHMMLTCNKLPSNLLRESVQDIKGALVAHSAKCKGGHIQVMFWYAMVSLICSLYPKVFAYTTDASMVNPDMTCLLCLLHCVCHKNAPFMTLTLSPILLGTHEPLE